jgi:hypothetical protein
VIWTMRKFHLDTDLGGYIDDLCALAMVLNWSEVELVAVTTVSDDPGKRAGYAGYALELSWTKRYSGLRRSRQTARRLISPCGPSLC